MKSLFLVLFLAVAHGFVVEEFRLKRSTKLDPPILQRLTAVDPPGFQAEWSPVSSGDDKDPVTGYKVKVWELPGTKTIKYEVINGVKTLVEDFEPKQAFTDEIPEGKPEEIITDKTKIRINSIKFNVFYEVRVQAFTKTTEGPLSQPMRIKLNKYNI